MDCQDNSEEFKHETPGTDENIKAPSTTDEKAHESDLPAFDVGDVFESGPRLIDLGVDGKERPIRKLQSSLDLIHLTVSISETDADYAIRLISLEDDPTHPIWTFRMWFLSLGLSCFGAVIGQIFVSI